MSISNNQTRRSFIQSASVGTAAFTLVNAPAINVLGANDRFTVGLIGCGGRGSTVLGAFMRIPNVKAIALCDVDSSRMTRDITRIEDTYNLKPQITKDHRELLENKDIDTVIIGTPDHWHTPLTIEALQAGKHVYCEKVASHNIKEGRALINAAMKYHNLTVQVGCHRRSYATAQDAIQFIKEGKLGEIKMIRTATQQNRSGQYHKEPDESTAPDSVDYDRWLGPAPLRPFNKVRFHSKWRGFYDYCNGYIGDLNVHLMDVVLYAMNNPYPISVCATGGKLNFPPDKDMRDVPDALVGVIEYPGFIYHYMLNLGSGENVYQEIKPGVPHHTRSWVIEFMGSNGQLFADRVNMRFTPNEGRGEPYENLGHPEDPIYHVENFLSAIRDSRTPACPPDVHHAAATATHLMNISYRVGRKLYYDYMNELCYQDPGHQHPDEEANTQLGRAYRKGYELPVV